MLEFFFLKEKKLKLIRNIFSKTDIVLDIGCGEKPYYHKAIKGRIICADIKSTKKTHIVCDAANLPIKDSKFDGIVCVNSFYYFSDPRKTIKEFWKALKKNGKLVIITPFIYPIHDIPVDKFRFTRYGLVELLKNDFEIKKIEAIGGIFNLPAIIVHSLIKGIPLMAPKFTRKHIRFLVIVLLYPFYILTQIFSLLDFLDRSERWTTYYFTLAVKK